MASIRLRIVIAITEDAITTYRPTSEHAQRRSFPREALSRNRKNADSQKTSQEHTHTTEGKTQHSHERFVKIGPEDS